MSLKRVSRCESSQSPGRLVLLVLALSLIGLANSFADSTLTYITVTTQTPATISPGDNALYTVTANRTGNGSFDVYCSVSGLPAGAAASFSPGVISFLDDSPSAKSASMTISTTAATPPGVYNFTITGRHGNSSKSVNCTGTLVIGADSSSDLPQRILSIDCPAEGSMRLHCSGKARRSYVIQASTSLNGDWVNLGTANSDSNGLFSFVDTSAGSCPCRFYRTSTP